jgi:diadenylate cyclase
MQAIGWLLGKLTDIWVIAFIILFQPEIRRLLLIIGRTNIARLFLKIDINQDITELVDACVEFQKRGWGALIVITRSTGIENIIETGILIQSKINTELLVSIFNPKSPMHDGAVIINNNKIEAAKCLLPLSETVSVSNRNLGTRHRAGLGISEVSDAITIIVSEERSVVSIAEDGRLNVTKDAADLKEKLTYALSTENVAKSVMKVFAKPDEKSKSN